MYALRARIRKSRKTDKPGTIILSIKEGNAERLFSTCIQSSKEELVTTHRDTVLRGLKCLYNIIEEFDMGEKPYNIDDIADKFRKQLELGIEDIDVSDFKVNRKLATVGRPFSQWANPYKNGKEDNFDLKALDVQNIISFITNLLAEDTSKRSGTLNNYKSIRRALSEFIMTLPKDRSNVDYAFVMDFQNWLRTQNISATTVSFYLKMVRSVFNKAKNKGLLDMSDNWFTGMVEYYKPNEKKNTENALSKLDIKRIAQLVIEDDPLMELSRDLFMFSFYSRGMELFDILHLTRKNINQDCLVYNKRLTGKIQVVVIDPQARKIIRKYMNDSDEYVFSEIKKYSQSIEYNTLRRIIIPKLVEMGKILGISTPIMFSTARNTWMSLMKASTPSLLLL